MRMGVLTRYLIRAHIGPFLFALTAITGLIFLNAVAQRMEGLVGKGLSFRVVAEFLVLSLPHTVALSLPMAVLVAVLYAFSELTEHNEIMAMSAGGIRPARVLVPLLGLGAAATAVMLFFNDSVLPEANHRLKNLLVDIGRKSPTLELREQVVNEIRTENGMGTYFLTANRIDPTTNTLEDVTIFDRNNSVRQRTTYATRGVMAFNEARTDLYLTLYDGEVRELQGDREGGFQHLFFERQIVPMRGVGDEFVRMIGGTDRGDREMDFQMLRERARERDAALDSLRQASLDRTRQAVQNALRVETGTVPGVLPPMVDDALPPSFLAIDSPTREAITLARSDQTRAEAYVEAASRYRVELHKKWAIAFACLVFTLIGPPLSLLFPRGGVGLVVGASTGIFAIYWMGLIGGESLADRGATSPVVAMWIPNLVFLLVGLALASRMGRAGATVRGGGWEETWLRVRGRFARSSRPAAGAAS